MRGALQQTLLTIGGNAGSRARRKGSHDSHEGDDVVFHSLVVCMSCCCLKPTDKQHGFTRVTPQTSRPLKKNEKK